MSTGRPSVKPRRSRLEALRSRVPTVAVTVTMLFGGFGLVTAGQFTHGKVADDLTAAGMAIFAEEGVRGVNRMEHRVLRVPESEERTEE